MRKIQIVLISAACLFFVASTVTAQKVIEAMTNADVVEMVKAALSEQVIIMSIRQAQAKDFDLAPTGLIALKKAGVTDTVILAMQEVSASAKVVPSGNDKMPADDSQTSPNDPNATLKQELLRIENQLDDAQIAGDKETLDKLLPDDYLYFQNGKSYNKAWFLKSAKPLKGVTAEIANAKVSSDGETATLSGISVIHFQNGSSVSYKFISKFVKRGEQWKKVSVTFSKDDTTLAEPKKQPVTSSQNPCADVEAMNKAQDDFDALFKQGSANFDARGRAIRSGKEFIEKYGACESAKARVDWLKLNIPKMEENYKASAPNSSSRGSDPPAQASNACTGIELLGLYRNDVLSGAIGGGVVEWLAKIRNNTTVTKIVVFGWRDMYGEQKKAQVQIRGGDIATPRLDMTQAMLIAPVSNLRVLSCQ